MSTPYNGNASNATGTQVTITDPVDGDDLTAASGTLPWNKEADWLQRLADIALNIATTAWTFTQAIVMQSTLAVTGAITGASIAVSGAVTAASATISGALSAGATTLSGALSGAAATFSGLLTANGGIAHETPLVVGGTGVAFQNSVTAASVAPRYWKDALGVVHAYGGVTRVTNGSAIICWTFPSGYHPGVQIQTMGWNVTAQIPTDVIVETNGDMKITINNANDSVYIELTFATF